MLELHDVFYVIIYRLSVMKYKLIIAFSLVTLAISFVLNFFLSQQCKLRINEIQPYKEAEIDGELYGQYVELFNTGKLAVNASRYFLSDDKDNLFKYELPDTTINAGEVLLVDTDPLILNFKSDKNQTIYLSYKSGIILDSVTIPLLSKSETICRKPNGEGDWVVAAASPAVSNSESQEYVNPPTFSFQSGFYDEPFDLEINADDGLRIFYTTDGSIPDINSIEYTDPIYVFDRTCEPDIINSLPRTIEQYDDNYTSEGKTDKAFIIRAVAINDSGSASKEISATYFVDKNKYSNSDVVSLITEPEKLYGDYGIYVTGLPYDTWYLGNQEGPAPYPLFQLRGRDFEIPAYFELISPTQQFGQDIGLRITGDASRNSRKKSFSLYARKEYSGKNVFDESIFQGIKSHKLALRGGYANSLVQRLVSDRNVVTQQSRRVNVFINGEFMYAANILEKYDARYFSEHYGISSDNIIVMRTNELAEGEAGAENEINEIYSFINSHDLSLDSNYEDFSKLLDLNNYIDYMCIRIYIDDMDFSEERNCIVWKAKNASSKRYEDGRWRFGLYDLDAMEFNDYDLWGYNSQAEKNTFSIESKFPNLTPIDQQPIFAALKTNKTFKREFVTTFMDLCNSTFSFDNVLNEMENYGEITKDYLPGSGGNHPKEYYIDFFKNRKMYISKYLAEEFNLQGTLETVNISFDQTAGNISVNSISSVSETGEWSGEYYTDYPIVITATPLEGYKFLRWEGDIDSTSPTIDVKLTQGGASIRAIFTKI